MGRPSSYTDEVADVICTRLEEGESLRKICSDPAMPSTSMVMRWLDDPSKARFREQYAHARERQAERFAEEIVDIADEATDAGTAAAARVKVDARKWVAAKLLPKKYGERMAVEHSGEGGGPVVIQILNAPASGDGQGDGAPPVPGE